MLAVAIDLLAGRYVASAYNDRDRAEWPPHPARLFSALVATWAEGEPEGGHGPLEHQALLWLEQQTAPHVLASGSEEIGRRDVVPVFVPVNDVFTVSPPDRSKLDERQDLRNAGSEEESAYLKTREKFITDTAKAIATPKKFTKEAVGSAEATVLAERRTRQPRTFPSATPTEPMVVFVWPDADLPDRLAVGFRALLTRLVRLGHSSTFVRANLLEPAALKTVEQRTTRFRPDEENGELVIRWVAPGQMERLAAAFERHQETAPRVLPAHFVRYTARALGASRAMPKTVFSNDDFIVFARSGGPRLPITSAAGVSKQFRRALMSAAEEPIPEMLSGHRADGHASEMPHLAIVPLPVVGSEHAGGSLAGIALIFPRTFEKSEREAVLRAVGRLESRGRSASDEIGTIHLELGSAGLLELERVEWGEPRRTALKSGWWSRPSRQWATATPIALDRNPGDLHDPDKARRHAAFSAAEDIVRTAVSRVIPSLEQSGTSAVSATSLLRVDVVRSCVLAGTAKPKTYPRFPADQTRPQRVLVHARLSFDQPVWGPLLIGAGRYHGLGLCLPVDETHPFESA
jgi:CRISPR-associated protein Csb2